MTATMAARRGKIFTLTSNAKRPAHRNPLRGDPTRTAGIRRAFVAEMTRRIKSMKRLITDLIVTEDAFGFRLKTKSPNPLSLQQRFAFETDASKVKSYKAWFKEQVDGNILQVEGDLHKPWTNRYVDSAYRKGAVRAYTDTHKEALAQSPDFYKGSQEQFLRDSFAQPEMVSKLELVSTRAFENLKGITEQMSAETGRLLADGLANGLGPRQIARNIHKAMDNISRKRALVLARTETAYAHSEGQLDSFEHLNVKTIKIMAEWSTAGDDRVCPQCSPLEGTVMTIKEARGIIPRHPNCRCAWIPANVGEPPQGQVRSAGSIESQIKASLQGERARRRTAAEAKRVSTWSGADKKIAKRRPKRFSGKTGAKRPPNKRPRDVSKGVKSPALFGHDTTQVMRRLGGEGFTLEETKALMRAAGHELKDSTVKGAWQQGVKGKYRGKVADLTAEQVETLRIQARIAVADPSVIPAPIPKPPKAPKKPGQRGTRRTSTRPVATVVDESNELNGLLKEMLDIDAGTSRDIERFESQIQDLVSKRELHDVKAQTLRLKYKAKLKKDSEPTKFLSSKEIDELAKQRKKGPPQFWSQTPEGQVHYAKREAMGMEIDSLKAQMKTLQKANADEALELLTLESKERMVIDLDFGRPAAKAGETWVNPGNVWVDGKKVALRHAGVATKRKVKRARDTLSRMVRKRPGKTETKIPVRIMSGHERAFANKNGVHIITSSTESTMVHEMVHRVEDTTKGLMKRVAEWQKHRIQKAGTRTIRLKDKFGGGYKQHEVGNPDDWEKLYPKGSSSPYYIGKTYDDGGTEVMTMGVELLIADPVKFAKTDPEYFKLIVGALRDAL